MRMPRKAGKIVAGVVVAEVVEQQERIELGGVAESERALQLDAGAFNGRGGVQHSLDGSDRHVTSPDSVPLYDAARRRDVPPIMRRVTRIARYAFALALVATAASAQTTLYEGARLIPGDGKPAIERSAFLVENGAITRVGRQGDVKAPAGATRVDLAGKTVMPALIDIHTHTGFQKGATYRPENYGRDAIVEDLNRALYFGVSAVVSEGIDPGDAAFRIRDDQAAGRLGGARLFTAGRGMGAPNAGPGADTYRGIAYDVTTEEEGRRNVRELAAQKVDFIKIWVDDRNGRAPELSAPLYRAIIDEAHKHGIRVNAHVFYLVDAKGLVAAGIDGFTHLVRDKDMDDELVQAIVKRRVVIMPTLQNSERGRHTEPPASLAAWLNGPARDAIGAELVAKILAGVRRPHARAGIRRARALRHPAAQPREALRRRRAHRPWRRHRPAGRSVRLRRASRAGADGRGRNVADARNRGGDQHRRGLPAPPQHRHARAG